ncbi:MAG: hypothetical protein AB1458_03575 [Bacteroidota bacterium]
MNKRSFILLLGLAVSATVLTSCGSGTENNDGSGDDTATVSQDNSRKNASLVFKSIPSPAELTSLIKQAGASYDFKLLNDVNNKSKYVSTTAKALNLGVYGADLSYASIFDQTQESMLYIQCAQALAGGIGAGSAFDDQTINRMNDNKGNSDSMLNIVTDTYNNTDDLLSEGGRSGVSALVVAGGWIEALYIGTQLCQTSKNNAEIVKRIAELKGSLENLIALLEENKDTEGVPQLIEDLKGIKAVYDGVGDNKTAEVKSTDEKNKITTLGGGNQMTLTPEQLAQITDKAASLRNRIIKP